MIRTGSLTHQLTSAQKDAQNNLSEKLEVIIAMEEERTSIRLRFESFEKEIANGVMCIKGVQGELKSVEDELIRSKSECIKLHESLHTTNLDLQRITAELDGTTVEVHSLYTIHYTLYTNTLYANTLIH